MMLSKYATGKLLLGAVTSALSIASASDLAAQEPGGTYQIAHARTCSVQELSRRTLRVGDGLDLYVAPKALVSNTAGDVLLAGTPNYLFRRDESGRGVLVARDSLFGVILKADGSTQTVASPMDPRTLIGVSAVARSDGGWDVAFAELKVPRTIEPSAHQDSVARLWHGVYDGVSWAHVAALPTPPSATFHPRNISSLAHLEDRLALAVAASFSEQSHSVVVYEWVDGEWSYEIVPTTQFISPTVVFVDSATLMLAVIGPQTTAAQRTDRNSLWTWIRDPVWREQRRVVFGALDGPAHDPVLTRSDGRVVLTWESEGEHASQVQALVDALEVHSKPVVVADPHPFRVHYKLTLPLRDGGHVWATLQGSEAAVPEVVLVVSRPSSELMRGSFANPFVAGFFQATQRGNDLMLSGADGDHDAGIVYSAVVTVRLECSD